MPGQAATRSTRKRRPKPPAASPDLSTPEALAAFVQDVIRQVHKGSIPSRTGTAICQLAKVNLAALEISIGKELARLRALVEAQQPTHQGVRRNRR